MTVEFLIEQLKFRSDATDVIASSDVIPELIKFYSRDVYGASSHMNDSEIETVLETLSQTNPWSVFLILMFESRARLQKKSPFKYSIASIAAKVDQELLKVYSSSIASDPETLTAQEKIVLSNINCYDNFHGKTLKALGLQMPVFARVRKLNDEEAVAKHQATMSPEEHAEQKTFAKAVQIVSLPEFQSLYKFSNFASTIFWALFFGLLVTAAFGRGPFISLLELENQSTGTIIVRLLGLGAGAFLGIMLLTLLLNQALKSFLNQTVTRENKLEESGILGRLALKGVLYSGLIITLIALTSFSKF